MADLRIWVQDSPGHGVGISLDLTFPNANHGPTQTFGCRSGVGIPLTVSGHLGVPECGVRSGKRALVPVGRARMPPATVDEHGDSPTRQDDVGCATECQSPVQTKPPPCGMECPAKHQLRSGVGSTPSCQVTTLASGDPRLAGHLLIMPHHGACSYPSLRARASRRRSLRSASASPSGGRAAVGVSPSAPSPSPYHSWVRLQSS